MSNKSALLDQAAATRLAKLCGMLGSAHDGERAAAGLKADQLVRELGLTWRDVIIAPPIAPERDTPPDWPVDGDILLVAPRAAHRSTARFRAHDAALGRLADPKAAGLVVGHIRLAERGQQMTAPLDAAHDLQQWIEAAGGYHLVDWAAWDAAVARYQHERRELLLLEQTHATPAGRRQAVGE
jgi:hypothetical protein